MREKCALSHGSGVFGRDPRDSCRVWSPHVENVCTVTQIRLGEGGGGGYHWGGGVGEPRTGIIYIYIFKYVSILTYLRISIDLYLLGTAKAKDLCTWSGTADIARRSKETNNTETCCESS